MIKSVRAAIGFLLGTASVFCTAVDSANAVELNLIAYSSLKSEPVLEPEKIKSFTPPKDLRFVVSEIRISSGKAWCDGDLINPTEHAIEAFVQAHNETSGPFVLSVVKSGPGPTNLRPDTKVPTLRLQIPPRTKLRFNATTSLSSDNPVPGGKSVALAWEFHYANGKNPAGRASIGILKK